MADQYRTRLVDEITMVVCDIENQLKVMKLVPNRVSPQGVLFFEEGDVTRLREAASALDSNQFKTNVGLTIGSSLGIAASALGITGLMIASGGTASILLGAGFGLGITGGTTTIMSTSNRLETQRSWAVILGPTLQKFCLIPKILQGTLTCFLLFLPSLHQGRMDMHVLLNRLGTSELENVKQLATQIKESLDGSNQESSLSTLLNMSEAFKRLLNIVFRGRQNLIDPEEEKEILNVIAALCDYALENNIKSLREIATAMTVSKVGGSFVLGLYASTTFKAANSAKLADTSQVFNAANTSGTPAAAQIGSEPIIEVSKFARAMKVAGIFLNVAGLVCDAAILGRTVKNMLEDSPSELSATFRDMADMIELFMTLGES